MNKIQKNTKTGAKPFIIGLCGGIGSGKSAAAQILMRLGAYIIDTDQISKQVTSDGTECNIRLKAVFPKCVAGGVLQRSMLKNLVFSDKNALKTLNSITHPYILAETIKQAAGKSLVAIQVPLLFESGFDKLCDVTVCIVSDTEKKLQRVSQRDKISKELAMSIMSAQLSDAELIGKCDFIIENNGSLGQLEDKVEEFFRKIQKSI